MTVSPGGERSRDWAEAEIEKTRDSCDFCKATQFTVVYKNIARGTNINFATVGITSYIRKKFVHQVAPLALVTLVMRWSYREIGPHLHMAPIKIDHDNFAPTKTKLIDFTCQKLYF